VKEDHITKVIFEPRKNQKQLKPWEPSPRDTLKKWLWPYRGEKWGGGKSIFEPIGADPFVFWKEKKFGGENPSSDMLFKGGKKIEPN